MKRSYLTRQFLLTHLAALALMLGFISQAMAQTMETFYEPVLGSRDDFPWEGQHGSAGLLFKVGSTNVMVTHLGYYDRDEDGLNNDHYVGIWGEYSTNLLASVLVTNGTEMVLSNSYRWVALDVPYLLKANTFYVLGAEVWRDSMDPWANGAARTNWNPMYVGTNGPTTRDLRYGGNPWPAGPENGSGFTWGANQAYGAANMATWPVGPAKAGMADSSVICTLGQTATILGVANGAAPLTIEWYKVPGTTPLPGKTNATLTIPNATLGDSGDYYLVAKNALGMSQSASCTLTVSAVPVSISTNPTNLTVHQNYSAVFYSGASGTPPITYQWFRNGSAIAGATQSIYTLAAAAMTNNGDTYSCVASNNAPGPFTAPSTAASLTVLANAGQPALYLHETIHGSRNTHTGTVGGKFKTGSGDVLVSHLGFYDKDNDGLTVDHHVGVFAEDQTWLGEVLVPSGTGAHLANGYRWMALDPPLVLSNNTTYILSAEVTTDDGDPWPDAIVPSNWDAFFVGNNGSSVILAYGGTWPTVPTSSWGGSGMIYGAPNMALLPANKPTAMANPLASAQYETLDASFDVTASGQPPVSVQWYKAPSTLLPGKTNSTLTLTGLTLGDSGEYYAIASNASGSGQSRNVTLTVMQATKPLMIQDPQSLSAYIRQNARFSVIATGLPPLSYEWKCNGNTIPNQTNSTLLLTDISVAGSAGNYQVVVTNPRGSTGSATATLTVLTPPAGSYMAAIMEHKPLVYYRFSDTIDIAGGSTNALNLGALGSANNGTYEVTCAAGDGPRPPTYAWFEAANQAVAFDAASDVLLPPLNLDTNSGAHVTMASWIYLNGAQADWAGIIFRRGSLDGGGCGFGLTTDSTTSTPNMLEYHWRDQYWDYASKLYVPDSQWVFVAFVVEPDKAILYLHNGTSLLNATNVAPHGAASIANDFFVGYDPAAASRRLNGLVDEAMVFDRALSQAEIISLYMGIPPVTLNASLSGGNVILRWAQGTLQQASEVNGTYVDISSATSPHTVTPTPDEPRKFYRVRLH